MRDSFPFIDFLVIPVDAGTGTRIFIGVNSSGDSVIEFYNAANELVMRLDEMGAFVFDNTTGAESALFTTESGVAGFGSIPRDVVGVTWEPAQIYTDAVPGSLGTLFILGPNRVGRDFAEIDLIEGDSNDHPQIDLYCDRIKFQNTISGVKPLLSISDTTDGSGDLVFTHGADAVPDAIFYSARSPSGMTIHSVDTFTATQATLHTDQISTAIQFDAFVFSP